MEGKIAQLFDVGAVDEHVDFGEQGVGGFVVARAELFERVAGVAPDVEAHGVDLLGEIG